MRKKIKDGDNGTPYSQDDINKQFIASAKEIQVGGIKEIPDTLISIYNDLGITAAAMFDNKKAFTYELSIPLKYLQQSLYNDNTTSNYNIKLNSPRITPQPRGTLLVVSISTVGINSREADDAQDLLSPTDFSGTYILAK